MISAIQKKKFRLVFNRKEWDGITGFSTSLFLLLLNMANQQNETAGPGFSNVGLRYPPDKSLSSG